jgi:hypothetical protein
MMKYFYLALTLAVLLVYGFVNLGPQQAFTTAVTFNAIGFTATAGDSMLTLTPYRDFVAGSTGTSFTVTAKSILRLQGMCLVTANAGAASQGVVVRLRINPSGTVTTSSPVLASLGVGTLLTTAAAANSMCLTFREGIDLPSTAQLGISELGTTTAGNDVTIWGYERVP